MRRFSVVIALLFAALGSQGCTPSCQQVCSKILDCDLDSTRVSRNECTLACEIEQDLFSVWEDDQKRAAFKGHKRCIRSSTCEEIAAGDCYDELVFTMDVENTSPSE